MPVPAEFERASAHFYKFLEDAKDLSALSSTHQTYTMVQGVLQTFRRRLDFKEAILFANVLPLLVRALFVTDWDIDEPKRPFQDREAMTKEVQSLRGDHNFSPDDAIQNVAKALRKNLDQAAFDRVLSRLPKEARQFWQA